MGMAWRCAFSPVFAWSPRCCSAHSALIPTGIGNPPPSTLNAQALLRRCGRNAPDGGSQPGRIEVLAHRANLSVAVELVHGGDGCRMNQGTVGTAQMIHAFRHRHIAVDEQTTDIGPERGDAIF